MPNVESIVGFFDEVEAPEPEQIESTGEAEEVAEPQAVESEELEAESDIESEESEGEESEPEYFNVKIDGEDYQVTLDEALAGYQRDSDYRKKTMTVAEERKAVEASKAAIDEKLQELDSFIKREEDSVDWDDLRRNDPAEYLAQKERVEAMKKIHAETQEKRSAELQQQREALVQSNIQKLNEEMGADWGDSEVKNRDIQLASDTMKEFGVTDDEVATIYDYRLWKMAIALGKATQKQASKAKVKEAVRKAPKSVKPGQRLPTGERKRQETVSQLANGKTRKSRIDALAQLLGE